MSQIHIGPDRKASTWVVRADWRLRKRGKSRRLPIGYHKIKSMTYTMKLRSSVASAEIMQLDKAVEGNDAMD